MFIGKRRRKMLITLISDPFSITYGKNAPYSTGFVYAFTGIQEERT